MNNRFDDILERIDEEPKWWDKNGYPRYCEFHPSKISNIYANEVILHQIHCQECHKEYIVAVSTMHKEFTEAYEKPEREYFEIAIHYGDPPNNCGEDCAAGASMNSEHDTILEFWVRDENINWKRIR